MSTSYIYHILLNWFTSLKQTLSNREKDEKEQDDEYDQELNHAIHEESLKIAKLRQRVSHILIESGHDKFLYSIFKLET